MAEDLAKQKLAHSKLQFETEQEKLLLLESEWQEMCQVMDGDLEQIKQNHYYREVLHVQIETQKSIVAQKQSLLKEATKKVILAARDKEIIENLKSLQVKEYRQLVLAEEQKLLDEVAVLRFTGVKD